MNVEQLGFFFCGSLGNAQFFQSFSMSTVALGVAFQDTPWLPLGVSSWADDEQGCQGIIT